MLINTPDGDYAPLDLRTLRSASTLRSELYIKVGNHFVLYRGPAVSFTPADRERLLNAGVSTLWIPTRADRRSQAQLRALLDQPDDALPSVVKAGLLYGSALAIARQTNSNGVSQEAFEEARALVGTTVSHMAFNRATFAALLSLMHHDFSVYTHAVNVAVYALGLGRFVGVPNDSLEHLGLGAILHDIGKAKVPKDILLKNGPLSTEEWDVVRQHPVWGTELLGLIGNIPETAVTVILQHHERLDGSGYPLGGTGVSPHPFAMIVALADSFDAMTSQRPYRLALTPFDALSRLKTEIAGKLDMELFTGLVHLLGGTRSIA